MTVCKAIDRNKKPLPFLQPNIVQGEGAITSDVIGSVCNDEKAVQSSNNRQGCVTSTR